jgi:hypothetical protein
MATKPTKAQIAAEKAKVDKELGVGDNSGVLGDIEHAGEDILGAPAGAAYKLNDVLNEGAKEIGDAITGKGGSDPSTPAKTSTTKKAASPVSEDKTLSEFANTLAEKYASEPLQAIGQEGTTLANENKAVTNAIAPFLTGSTAYNAGGSADPSVQAAMDAYAKAYAAGEGVNSAAYAGMGLANEQYLAASPEASYLQLLSQPGSAYYKEIPSALMSQLPESLQYALQAIGQVNEGAAAPPKGGWSQAVKSEFGSGVTAPNVANALTAGLGTVPGSPTSPTSLSGGNPSVAGS